MPLPATPIFFLRALSYDTACWILPLRICSTFPYVLESGDFHLPCPFTTPDRFGGEACFLTLLFPAPGILYPLTPVDPETPPYN
jgi:hypothetical protein